MKKGIIITLAVTLSIILILFLLKGVISKQIYMRQTDKLAEKLSADLAESYNDELYYTMNKFWSCYRKDIISKNDLNEVMDRIKALNQKESINRGEIFDFIDYTSDIYTTATIKRNLQLISQQKKMLKPLPVKPNHLKKSTGEDTLEPPGLEPVPEKRVDQH